MCEAAFPLLELSSLLLVLLSPFFAGSIRIHSVVISAGECSESSSLCSGSLTTRAHRHLSRHNQLDLPRSRFFLFFVFVLFVPLRTFMIPSASLRSVRSAAAFAFVFDHHPPCFLSNPFASVNRVGRSKIITHLGYLVRDWAVASSGHAHDDLIIVR